MTLLEFKKELNNTLKHLYPKYELDTFFFWIIEEYLSMSRAEFLINPNTSISDTKNTELDSILKRLCEEEPIQYIFGHTEFYGHKFFVNKHTLIPRPETEELVSWVLEEINNTKQDSLNLLDIGTGSGCIAISLKKHLNNAQVTAIDISSEALETAKKNAELNEAEVAFLQVDILGRHEFKNSFDCIIANPPYVRELEKSMMKNNVLKYEPQQALFVPDNDPLIFYRKIASLAKKSLSTRGVLFFEINEYLSTETKEMIHVLGFEHVDIKMDNFGKNRFIKAYNEYYV